MKRILSILLALAVILSLTACKSENETEGGGATPAITEKTAYEKAVELLGSLEASPISQNPDCHIFKIADSGVQVRYIEIDAVSDGEPVNIMQLTDSHFNALNERDKAENNAAVMSSYENREYCRDEASVQNTLNALQYHTYFDAVAVTGDNIDYLTWGSLELLKKHFWDPIDNIIMTLGNHEATRQMTGTVPDSTTLQSRYDILQSYWEHDINYYSTVIKDRVMLIQMNNSSNKYVGDQPEKLAADIEKARQQQLTVLIFQHIPLGTRNPDDSFVYPLIISSGSGENFYANHIGGARYNADTTTQKVYDLITQNADVVRGVFCGHLHHDYYVEIPATYQKDGQTVETVIPQVVLNQSFNTNGHFLAIMVD